MNPKSAEGCVTLTLLFPMVIDPDKAPTSRFGPTERLSVPLPFPLLAPETLIHTGTPVTVHAQPVGALMVRFRFPPVAGNSNELGTENEQFTGLISTVSVCEAVWEIASVTLMANVCNPVWVGVPEIVTDAPVVKESVNPRGNNPDCKDQ